MVYMAVLGQVSLLAFRVFPVNIIVTLSHTFIHVTDAKIIPAIDSVAK